MVAAKVRCRGLRREYESSLSAKGRINGNNGNYNCLSVCQKLCQMLYDHYPDYSTPHTYEMGFFSMEEEIEVWEFSLSRIHIALKSRSWDSTLDGFTCTSTFSFPSSLGKETGLRDRGQGAVSGYACVWGAGGTGKKVPSGWVRV